MTIKKSLEGKNLTISLEGRLDTNTAIEFEKEIVNFDEIENLTLDFEKLEYISSSGLRLILKCKKMKDSTKIINCNPEVYEVFNITGFVEMMSIEKALRKISIENCEKIGEGFFGNIYKIDDETIVKVYKIPDSLESIKRERELAKKAFILGVPTAIPYDIVKVDNLYGAVFELLDVKPIVNIVNSDKELDDFAQKTANILKELHTKKIKAGEIPSRKEIVKNLLKECEKYFSKEVFEKLLKLLESIPETNTLLHCDFQIKNLMIQNDELLLIDMDTLSVGHPIFELASMYATYNCYACIDKLNTVKFLGIPLETTQRLFDKTFRYYYNDKNNEELEDIKLKLSIISYIQVLSLRTKYVDNTYEFQKAEIEYCCKYLSENSEKLETLKY